MDTLTDILFCVSNALLVPVIIILLCLFFLMIFYLGGMTGEALNRSKWGKGFRMFIDELKTDPNKKVQAVEIPKLGGIPGKAFQNVRADKEKIIDDLQLESEHLLGRLMFGIRLGPILGLTGTLIPLGPALTSLSTGDISTLSSKLVVAFTTTVLGLLVGGVCFAMHSIRRRWYMQDLNDIEFIMKRMDGQ